MLYAEYFLAFANHLELILRQGGYVILGLLTLLEGLPVIGMAVPGHTAVLIAGFLARIGTLNLAEVLIISSLGAILGDYLGFYLGRKYGMSFIDRIKPYFFVTDLHIEKAKAVLDRHTGKSMILGRFTPATRALLPFMVGASHTPAGRFWLFNIIGGVSWAVISVMIGYIFGEGYSAAAGFAGKIFLFAILSALVIMWGYRFVNMHFHVFRRYELFTLSLNLFALLILGLMIEDASSLHPFMINLDIFVSRFTDSFNHTTSLGAFATSVSSVLEAVFGTAIIAGLGIILAGAFVWKRKWRSAAITILAIGGTGAMVGLLKQLFQRVRPENALEIIVNDPSFPSGHASMSAALFTIVAYFLLLKIGSRNKREIAVAGCVLMVLIIGISRLVLNVHWLSDVLAGWALGLFVATASILLVKYAAVLFCPKKSGDISLSK